ncbi:MAG: PqqD family protein [Clostridia bacterium]|nr:PqqD family protein [Clostridia bacterium]
MKISGGFVVQKIGDSYYAVPVTTETNIGNGMVKLNETAYFMWKKFEEGLSAEETAAALREEYNVDTETALADVKAFALSLGKAGILERTDEA